MATTKNTFPPPKDIKTPFSYKNSLYNGGLMIGGISLIAYIVEKCGCLEKKYYINVNTNQLVTLCGIIVLSRFGIDYIKRERLIPREM